MEAGKEIEYVCVDLLGFRAGRGRFICKEFALIDHNFEYHAFVTSTMEIRKLKEYHQRHAQLQTNYFHRIPADYGDITVPQLFHDIHARLTNKTILVWHSQKADFLKYLFRHYDPLDILSLEKFDIDISQVEESHKYKYCDYHNRIFGWGEGLCALQSALKLSHMIPKVKSVCCELDKVSYVQDARSNIR